MHDIAASYNWDVVQVLENVWGYPGFPSLDATIKYARFLNPMTCKGI